MKMKINLYSSNGRTTYLHKTEFGLMVCKSEDISKIPDALLEQASGQCINQQYADRLLLNNGMILHSMDKLPVLDCPQASKEIGDMIVLCDQQGYNPPQGWLVNANSMEVLQKGIGPDFFGYPQDGMQPASFLITYRDRTVRKYTQLVTSLPEDVLIETKEEEQVEAVAVKKNATTNANAKE